ncbi:unnamed protein product [Brassica oleracea var. botrytis]
MTKESINKFEAQPSQSSHPKKITDNKRVIESKLKKILSSATRSLLFFPNILYLLTPERLYRCFFHGLRRSD